MVIVGNEQLASTKLRVQLEQQQRLLEMQAKRAEQLQLDVELANAALDKEKQKNTELEKQLLQSKQDFRVMLETEFGELALIQELARLKAENENLKHQYDYVLDHSAEQQLNLESTLAKLKSKMQLVYSEKEHLEKTNHELDIQLVSYKKQLAKIEQQFDSEKQALQIKQVTEVDIVTRIYTTYTEPHLANHILLADFLGELKNGVYMKELAGLWD